MRTIDIARKYGIDQNGFEGYLRKKGVGKIGFGFSGMTLEENIQEHVEGYKQYLAEKTKKESELEKLAEEEAKRKKRVEGEKQKALASMLITSGFNFDGYKIKKYSGYISGDDAISVDRGTSGIFSSATDVSESLTASLVKIRRQAIKELKEAAYDLGCNAVIGVDFDYITLEPETANSRGGTTYLPYVFCVTANGNAVIIEKEE